MWSVCLLIQVLFIFYAILFYFVYKHKDCKSCKYYIWQREEDADWKCVEKNRKTKSYTNGATISIDQYNKIIESMQ